jgi:autotransporter-associated beta strand protein
LGNLTLCGTNTYSGPTTINSGILLAGSPAGYSINSPVVLANTVAAASTNETGIVTQLYLNGWNNTVGSLTGGGAVGGFANLTTATLTVGSDNTSPAAFSGQILGTGALVKIGTGTQTINGFNTFSGGTTINNGVVSLTGGSGVSVTGITATTTAFSSTITVSSTAGLAVGQPISGTDIPTSSGGATITSIGPGNQITINVEATASGTPTLTAAAYSGLGTGTILINSGGTLSLSGAALQNTAGAMTVKGNGYATQDGAFVNASGSNTYAGLITLGSAATIASDAGTLVLSNAGTITGATFGLTLTGAGNGTLASVIGTTTGGLTKNGAGAWTLTGNNTYTGATTVNAGTLIVNGKISGNSSSSLNVAAGTLAGTGTLSLPGAGTPVEIGGTLAPGTAGTIGTINFTLAGASNMNFESNSTLGFDISGASSDLVNFTAAPASGEWLSGAGNATLALSGSIVYTDTYVIFQNAIANGVTGAFSFANITGYDSTDYVANFTQVGDNYDLSFTATAVPEPSTWAAMLSGFGMLLGLQRLRNRRQVGA